MQHRIVRPAILSIVGVYSPLYIATGFLPSASAAGGLGSTFVIGGLLAGAWLSSICILLLLDTVRHRIWGSLIAISYAIAFPLLFYFSEVLSYPQTGTLIVSAAALPAIITPVVGLIGGIWGYLWKSPNTAITPETVALKEPSLSRFRSNNPLLPALLCLAGTALPLFLLIASVAGLFAPPQPPPEGGVGPDFGPFFLILIAGAAAFAVLLPTSLSILLLFDPRRHRTWGAILTILYGLASVPLALSIGVAIAGLMNGANGAPSGSQTTSGTYSLLNTLYFTPLLGLAGGIWGFYWHTGVNPRSWTLQTVAKTLGGLSGRVTIGGAASIICEIFASPFLAILPFFLVVSNIQFGRSGVKSRVRGLLLLGLVVASGLLVLGFEYVDYVNNFREPGPHLAGLAGLVALFLAGSGLVWSIRGQSSNGKESTILSPSPAQPMVR